jgi:hypothetical protein
MTAYVHGADHYGTKLASVHGDNPDRRLVTVKAQIALTAAGSGEPAAYIAGTLVTNARTGCIGGLAVRHLTRTPVLSAAAPDHLFSVARARDVGVEVELSTTLPYCARADDPPLACCGWGFRLEDGDPPKTAGKYIPRSMEIIPRMWSQARAANRRSRFVSPGKR